MDSTASALKSSAARTEERVNDWAENQTEESTFSKVKTAVSSAASKVGEFASDTYQSVKSQFTGDSSEDKPSIPYARQDQPNIPDDRQEQPHIQKTDKFS
jgi:hypothetical protein